MVKSNVLYMEGLNIYKGSKAASHVGMIPSNKKKKKKKEILHFGKRLPHYFLWMQREWQASFPVIYRHVVLNTS